MVGVVVGSKAITLVEGEMGEDGAITLTKDETFDLEDGDRHTAYAVMYRRIADRFVSGVERVIIKASSAGAFSATTGLLQAAELRGVLLCAIPSSVEVVQVHAKTLSRTFGSRKIADYTKDEVWWKEHFGGKCRKGSREAAFLLIASEDR